ncbi:MAG: pilus assembly protein N-terminal domain-containing protein [Micavibrio sp.]|nr:pilus assembly protein N-terminal domain-containing protein [Micavibrio sp.]
MKRMLSKIANRVPRLNAPRTFMGAAAVILAVGLSVVAQGATGGITKSLHLTAGKAETVSLPKAAADVLVANPAIADVGSLRSDRLYVVGKALGDTNVLAFDEDGNQLADISVHVAVDEDSLRASLRQFFPKEAVEVHTVNDNIVLQGMVSTPGVANQVRDLAGRFIKTSGQTLVDLMTVRGEQQVMLKVKVVEAQRDLLREIGIDTTIGGINVGKATGSFGSNGVGLTAVSQFGTGTIALANGGNLGPISADISGLERDGLINLLAEPTLTAISGETAGFLAGGEFPVPSGRDSSGNVSIEFKQFGVSLNFIPTVLGTDRISMQLTSEVSEKSDQDSVTLATGGGSTIIPGLTVRRAQTTVQMGSGGTLMIAGLLKSRTVDAVNGFPGLKDLPILGELFKSKSFQRGESELVFLVTPYVVEPYAMPQADRVTADDNSPPRAILPIAQQTPPHVPPAKGSAATLNPATDDGSRFNDVTRPVAPPVQQQHYQPQGEERTAGTKKVDATPAKSLQRGPAYAGNGLANNGGLSAAEQLTMVSAPVADVAAAPLPSPVRSVGMQPIIRGQGAVTPAATAKMQPIMTKPVTLAARPAAVQPSATPPLRAVGMQPIISGSTTTAAAPVSNDAQPLAATASGNGKKVYGNRLPPLGENASYGYIVD